jgi:diaminopimelate decarboxylase
MNTSLPVSTKAEFAHVIRSLRDQVRTPFYLYRLDGIRARAQALRGSLRSTDHALYAMKANSHSEILKLLAEEGWGVDAVSAGEIRKALDAGVSASRMAFSGVAKTAEEIRFALESRVAWLNSESLPELERIAKISRELGVKARVNLRINPDVDARTHPYISTGLQEHKFGIDLTDLGLALTCLRENASALHLQGVAFHIGSQMLDLTGVEESLERALRVIADLRTNGFSPETLDIGGGYGIAYQEHEQEPDVASMLSTCVARVESAGLELAIEPGRFLVGPEGVLVTEIQYIKRTKHKRFVIVDTGMHHLIRPALYGAYHHIQEVQPRGGPDERAEVVGPICETSDILGKDRLLSRDAREGDWLMICDAGAYGASMASRYNLFEPASEWFWEGSEVRESDSRSTLSVSAFHPRSPQTPGHLRLRRRLRGSQ